MSEPIHQVGRPQRGWPVLLSDQFARELRQYLARRLAGSEDARDLAQEVYLRLLRLGKIELAADSPVYLFTVAANVVREFKLRARRQPVLFDSEVADAWHEDPAVASDPDHEAATAHQELQSALLRLPPTYRLVLLLSRRDGMSFQEIARQLDLSVHTVKKYGARAAAMLRESRKNEATRRRP